MEKKKSFLLYTEHKELIEQLSSEQAGELFKGLFDYVLTGEVPDLDPLSKMAFISVRQDLDRNAVKYEEFVEKQRQNGLKGGRPKKEENPKNPSLFSETQKSLYDNVNDNENDNVNVNVNVNDNDNDNVLSHSEKGKITENEKEILEKYVIRKKLATKNVRAYINKIIQNGDHISILEKEKARLAPQCSIEEDIASVKDKRSAAKVLAKYYQRGSPPEEFSKIMKKYNLDTYDKMVEYSRALQAKRG